MIVLCHIVDEFKEFEKKFLEIKSKKYNMDFVYQLWEVSKGKFKLGATKAKQFYNENKSVIDTINKYSNVSMFLNQNYGYHGAVYGDFQFFYQYLLSHKEEIPKILVLLEKIKKLGFDKFKFNENFDFSKETYNISPSFIDNFDIIYIANPQVIPNYTSRINYMTLDSNYKIEGNIFLGDEINKDTIKITLNSLLFDPNTLPLEIDKEHTFDHIIDLKKQQKDTTDKIRNSIDLNISVYDLENQLNSTDKIINDIDGIKNKQDLIAVLSSIKEKVEALKTLSSEYDSSVLENDPMLSQEILEEEKKQYLYRRKMEDIDFC